MKTILMLITLGLAASAAAATKPATRFLCKVTKQERGKNAYVSFVVHSLGTAQVDWVWPKSEMGYPFKATHGAGKIIESGIANGYVAHEKNGDLVVFGDDGVSVAGLHIYRNSGYKKGYMRARYGTVDGGRFYAPIYCRVSNSRLR